MHVNKLEVPYECESDNNEDGEVNNTINDEFEGVLTQVMTCLVRGMSHIVVKKSYFAQAMTCLVRAMTLLRR